MAALLVSGACRHGAKFSITLDWVAISHEAVEEIIACVQDFVRDPSLTQRSFFWDSGVAILENAVVVADSVILSGEYKP